MTWKRSRRARSCSRSPGRPRRWQTNRARPPPRGRSPDPTASHRKWWATCGSVSPRARTSSIPKTWAGSIPAAFGIAPRLRIGANRWFNLLWLLPIGWVAAARRESRRLSTSAGCPRSKSSCAGIPGPASPLTFAVGHAGLAARPALPEPVLPDLHHPRRAANPRRPSPAVLDAALDAREGVAPHAEAGAGRSALDGQAGLPHAAEARRAARHSPLHRSGALVASRRRHAVARERARLLRAAVRDRRMAPHRPDELAGVPRCRLGPAPVPIPALARGRQLGRVQRPPDACLLHHGLHRRAARARDRAGHVARALYPVPRHQQAAEHSDRALPALSRPVLVSRLHLRSRHAGLRDRPAAEPEPHLHGDRRERLGRLRHLRRVHGALRDCAGWRPRP